MGQESRLRKARDVLSRRYAEPITLEKVSREVGLNRLALTSGFRQLFQISVYDYLQKERMERAYELLQQEGNTVASVAAAVGFSHPCNFSTAFRAHFGCTPTQARGDR
jgi:AraC family transcriptional activator of pyochelin receptor